MALDPTPPPLTRLHYTWALIHVGEYACTMCVLAPTTRVAPLVKTIASFHHLHPLVEVDLPLFVDDFHSEMDLVLDKEAFIFSLTHLPCLSFDDLSSMVYEILQDYFVFDDSANCGFDILFEICGHIICGHVLSIISHLLVAS